jgi:hypothetical protein
MDLKEQILEQLKIFTNDKFKFQVDSHSYFYGKKKFTSVTTFLKNFKKEFNTEHESEKKAIKILKKEGKELDEVTIKIYQNRLIKEWTTKKDVACELGGITHKVIEDLLNGSPIEPILNDEAAKRYLKFKKLFDSKIKPIIIPLGQEIKVYSEELELAGTIDCLILRLGKDGKWKLEIWDWKTNGKFTTDSDFSFNNLLAPFADEKENKLNEYSIQLNLYKLILASKGILIDGECVIVYIPPNEDEPKIIKCKDYIPKLEMYFGVNFYTKLKNQTK